MVTSVASGSPPVPEGSRRRAAPDGNAGELVPEVSAEHHQWGSPKVVLGAGAADWERRMRGGIRRSRGCAPSSARAGSRRPEVVEHEVGNLMAELLAGHEVDHGVIPGEDPAERGFVGCRLEAVEGPRHAGISVRTDGQRLAVTVEGAQNGGRRLADGRVGAGVG